MNTNWPRRRHANLDDEAAPRRVRSCRTLALTPKFSGKSANFAHSMHNNDVFPSVAAPQVGARAAPMNSTASGGDHPIVSNACRIEYCRRYKLLISLN